jgi:hypothetical protein
MSLLPAPITGSRAKECPGPNPRSTEKREEEPASEARGSSEKPSEKAGKPHPSRGFLDLPAGFPARTSLSFGSLPEKGASRAHRRRTEGSRKPLRFKRAGIEVPALRRPFGLCRESILTFLQSCFPHPASVGGADPSARYAALIACLADGRGVLLAYHRSPRGIIGHCRFSPPTKEKDMTDPRPRGLLFRQAPF